MDWIRSGDRNTSYFHRTTLTKRRCSRIETLKDEAGNAISGHADLKKHAVEFFSHLFTGSLHPLPSFRITHYFPSLSLSQVDALNLGVTMDEMKQALFDMKPLKAPGSNGLHAIFSNQIGLQLVLLFSIS